MQPEVPPDPDIGAPARRAVVDTNVWLDLLVFADPAAEPLGQALRAGRLRALRDAATEAELAAVLQRPQFAARPGARDLPELLARWQTLAERCAPARPAPWRCRDPGDQKFLDLAFGNAASLLVTKDRALLELARLTRRDGLDIMTPGQFALHAGRLVAARAPDRPQAQGT